MQSLLFTVIGKATRQVFYSRHSPMASHSVATHTVDSLRGESYGLG